ncbi:pilus assembly protein FimV [Lysobacter niastensis]|uniref:Pilus assembly protein FimV n=1 Tax=Lysobacter niastensis TaxID=380629 RepID=A0ABU1W9F8_9GAMM|nr:FimV/HubP family polar landmark protein [Lysobacter niastensis]MDR7134247.1 pilus assembly protein FimV [Lysobacter niastensis]
MKRYARTALALALALSSGSAAALGLGQIEVRSRVGQPFLAEIPVISSDPAELENLQAELASPITFARIGLQPPMGVVADLQFTSALDASGNPVIRVTSQQPVNEPLLTFLVSVDWGQGRLVREYSALLDTPRTVSAPLQPQVEEAMVSAPNIVERAPVAAPAPEPEPQEADPAPVDQAPNNAIAATPEPRPEPRPEPVAVAPPPPMPAPAPAAAAPEGELRVRSGDTLSEIARQVDTPAYSLDQTMIALLRANPDAFIGGNINRLRQGAVLRVPTGNELSSVEAAQASRLISSQMQQWQAARRPMPQPASASATTATAGAVGAPAKPASAAPVASASRTAEARLEIVPPGASRATQAGTQSGINAGGEGEMLRQELQQTQESLAARDAELRELKGRVAELEQLQTKQQQLITMKDSELAASQQRLAQAQQRAGEGGGAMWPWLAGGGVILLALGAGWLLRRRPAKPVFRAPGATPSIADAFAAGPAAMAEPEETSPAAKGAEIAAAAVAQAPAWHVQAAGQGRQEPLLGAQPGEERLELARAYLDLGDHDSARQLLSDIVINGDLIARQQAARMLQELE